MGNNLSQTFEISPQITCTGGPGNYWRIHRAWKKSNRQEYSVFICDKSTLSLTGSNPSTGRNIIDELQTVEQERPSSKEDIDKLLAVLRREPERLTKLRHPGLLEIVEPLVETRSTLAFVTEPIIGNLSELLRVSTPNKDSESVRYEFYGCGSGDACDMFEYQKGLWQLCSALEFLHQGNVRLVHGQLAPEHIYINQKGDWKLGGMGWSAQLLPVPQIPIQSQPSHSQYQQGLMDPTNPFATLTSLVVQSAEHKKQTNPQQSVSQPYPQYEGHLWKPARQNLDFTAPECLFDQQIHPGSDIFSLACLIYTIVHPKHDNILASRDHLQTYKQSLSQLYQQKSYFAGAMNHWQRDIPPELRQTVERMLSRQPIDRPSASQILQERWLNGLEVSSLRQLETAVFQLSGEERPIFYRGLLFVQQKFSRYTLLKKILPILLNDLKDFSVVPIVFQNILAILPLLPDRNNEDTVTIMGKVLSAIVPVIFSPKSSNECADLFADNFDMISSKTADPLLKSTLLPYLISILEHNGVNSTGQQPQPSHILQQKSLGILFKLLTMDKQRVSAVPSFLFDYQYTSTQLLPRLLNISEHSTNILVRINSIQCLSIVAPKVLDFQQCQVRLKPILKQSMGKHFGLDCAISDSLQALALECGDTRVLSEWILGDLWHLLVTGVGRSIRTEDQYEHIRKIIQSTGDRLDQVLQKSLSSKTTKLENTGNIPAKTQIANSIKSQSFEELVMSSSKSSAQNNGDLTSKLSGDQNNTQDQLFKIKLPQTVARSASQNVSCNIPNDTISMPPLIPGPPVSMNLNHVGGGVSLI